ncbi:putative ribonuclease H-like domain-containing protein [Tanacetum coccineum]
METSKPLMKDENAEDVNVHLYRSMIGSLMYLTSSRPDIMFVVCACARFQVTPKVSHLHAVKRIFRYLKGQPKLGLWYPKDSPFDLEAYTDSDYAGASLDRKSTTGGCQFLRSRLISWQCKKQTVVANSTTEAEYVAASNCCGQVLWIQNQLLDYGYNFMNTKIFIDNESTICIVKNPVFHSKTKHIEIRHHFIRDSYEKILIQVIKIHTSHNVADLLTKAFDVSRFQYLIARWLEWSAKAAKDEIEAKVSAARLLNTARQNSSRAAISVNTARPINTAYPRPTVNYARPASNVFNRAHSHVRRPFNKFTTNKNNNLNEKVNIVRGNVTTVGPKVVVNDKKGNLANVVKASACWVWRPKQKVIDHIASLNSPTSQYYEELMEFVAFGGVPKGGRITGKGKISTDTECVVLSPDFKLLDENHVLLRVPRKDNIYSVDLKNIVPSRAERKNRTLVEAARTMLADSKLPIIFWAEAVSTACYVQNRVLVIKPHNKTPYELFLGKKHALSFMRPFRHPVTILNTIDHLGKFDGKADEGFFVGYSTNSKAYRVFNSRTMIVEENLHVKFSEETPNIAGNRSNWLFDIDALTISMNYKPVVAGNQTNGNAGTKENIDACQAGKKIVPDQEYILLPLLTSDPSHSKSLKDSPNAGFKPSGEEEKMI